MTREPSWRLFQPDRTLYSQLSPLSDGAVHRALAPAPVNHGAPARRIPLQPLRSQTLELYSPGPMFTWPELQGMALDGLLQQLYRQGYAVPGTAVTPRLRARAAAISIPSAVRRKVAAGRMTAAWIYGCAPEPDRLALLVDARHRVSSLRSTRGCTLHEVRLGSMDVHSMGGLMVTSPLRTAVDISLNVAAERALPTLRSMAAQRELGVRLRLVTLAVEASPRIPHKKTALAILKTLEREIGQDG